MGLGFAFAVCAGVSIAPRVLADPAAVQEQLAKAPPGEEVEVEPNLYIAMFRQQASNPLPDGWHRAVSTEGGFSVELPLPFNDFRMRTEAKDKVELRIHTIGSKSVGKLSYSATCMARRDGKPSEPGTPKPSNKTESMGTPIKAYARTVVWPDRLCMVIVEAQGDDPLPPEGVRNRFLNSLKQVGRPQWPAPRSSSR